MSESAMNVGKFRTALQVMDDRDFAVTKAWENFVSGSALDRVRLIHREPAGTDIGDESGERGGAGGGGGDRGGQHTCDGLCGDPKRRCGDEVVEGQRGAKPRPAARRVMA